MIANVTMNKWEFDIKTSIFCGGFDPSDCWKVITLPEDIVENINTFVVDCINSMLFNFMDEIDNNAHKLSDNNDLGQIKIIEMGINHILQKQHAENGVPHIRIELYQCSIGLRTVVNVMPSDIHRTKLIYKPEELTYEN